jgi:hypothetical protein
VSVFADTIMRHIISDLDYASTYPELKAAAAAVLNLAALCASRTQAVDLAYIVHGADLVMRARQLELTDVRLAQEHVYLERIGR